MLSNRGSLPTPHYDLRKIRLLIFSFVGENRPFLEPFKVNSKENGKEMRKKIFFHRFRFFDLGMIKIRDNNGKLPSRTTFYVPKLGLAIFSTQIHIFT